MLRRLAACSAGVLGLFCAAPISAIERVRDGLPERAVVSDAVRRQFLAREFAALEKMATEARNGLRFTDGCWQLPVFYGAFSLPRNAPPAAWESWVQRLDQWDQAVPGSITARLARAEAWASRAGLPGQDGGNNPEAEVRRILDTTPGAKRCPGYFQIMLWLGRRQGWPREEFEAVFREAIALAPDYEAFYFRKAASMSLYRAGRGEIRNPWEKFAAETPALTSPALGQGMYTRIVWSLLDKSIAGTAMEAVRMSHLSAAELAGMEEKAKGDPARATLLQLFRGRSQQGGLTLYDVDWNKMKAGFEDLARLYPESLWNKNAFCFYAFCANDRETTARLMTELRDRVAPGVWPSEQYYNQVKEWATTGRVRGQ